MNILLSTDNNYVMPTGILMHSINIHNKDVNYYVLINPGFSEENKKSLSSIAKRYSSKISFYVINDEVTRKLPFGEKNMPQHVTLATYYRLFIDRILPESVHKIIYLDGDMIVRKDISYLWNIDLKGKAAGVVHDMDEKRHADSKRLPYPMDLGYFNAGMMLINLDYWRENDCLEQFHQFIQNHGDKIQYHDQDVLNSVLCNHLVWVPLTYNFQSGFLYKRKQTDYPISLQAEVEHTRKHAAIVHFSTPIKPWYLDSFHPYTAAWRYYKVISQWKNVKLIGDDATSIKKKIRNFFVRHCLWNFPCEYLDFKIRK